MNRIATSLFAALMVVFAFTATAGAHELGTQTNLKTAIVLVKFPDRPTPSLTAAQARVPVFDQEKSVHSFYLADSVGTLGLTGIDNPDGDVLGYYDADLPYPADGCTSFGNNYTDGIDAQASAMGDDLAAYDRIIYVVPDCSSSSRSFAGAAIGRVWVLGPAWNDVRTIIHELGHTMPSDGQVQGHANGMVCNSDSFNSIPAAFGMSCLYNGYADVIDPMGNGNYLNSSFVRAGFGFLPRSTSLDVSTEGVYEVSAIGDEVEAGETYNLRIPTPNRTSLKYVFTSDYNSSPGDEFLNIEYRQPHGLWDAGMHPWETDGAYIRMARDYGVAFNNQRVETMLVDADPHSSAMLWWKKLYGHPWFKDYYYEPGRDYDLFNEKTGFYDPANDILLNFIGRDSEKLTINYSKGLLASEKTSVGSTGGTLSVQTQANYANDIRVRAEGSNIVVRDGNAPVLASGSCVQQEKNVAACPSEDVSQVSVATGDKRDYIDLRLAGVPVTLDAGSGDDFVMAIGATSLQIDCGSGADKTVLDDPDTSTSCETADIMTTSIGSAPSQYSTDATPDFTFSATNAQATFECSNAAYDGQETWEECTSPLQLPALADGHYTFKVRALTPSGSNVPNEWEELTPATVSYWVDSQAPTVTITSPSSSGANSPTVPLAYSATDQLGHSEECSLDGSTYAACPATLGPLSAGDHTLDLRSTDLAGNAATYTHNFTVQPPDSAGPTLEITAPAGLTGGNSPTIAFTATDVSGVQSTTCRVDTGSTFPCTSGQTLTALADGGHTLTVTATDTYNNETVETSDFIIDATGANVTITAPQGTITTTNPTVVFTATDANGVSLTSCTLDTGQQFSPCTSGQSLGSLSVGAHWVVVGAVDGAGNTSSQLANFTVTSPSLTASSATAIPSSVNLTSAGALDWAHWGRSSATTFDRRNGTQQISNYTRINGGSTNRATGVPTYTWSNGTPQASGSTNTAVYTGGAANRGFRVTAPASNTQVRQITLYVGVLSTTGKLTASLSDGSVATISNTSISTSSIFTPLHRQITISYRSASPTATLTLDWTQNTSSAFGRVYLHSATLN